MALLGLQLQVSLSESLEVLGYCWTVNEYVIQVAEASPSFSPTQLLQPMDTLKALSRLTLSFSSTLSRLLLLTPLVCVCRELPLGLDFMVDKITLT